MHSDKTHAQLRELLDLELEGELGALERRELERHLAGCADCARERAELAAVHAALAASRMPVRDGFRDAVMAALPQAGWEARPVSAWRLPAAMMVLLAAGAALLLGTRGLGGSLVGALASVLELLGATALAGAGLLGASWKGLGLVVSQALEGSPLHLAVAGIGVVCLDLLVLRMIRRRRAAPAPVRTPR